MNEQQIEELFRREEDNPRIWLRVASERLSLLRYVFLVQIEDGIPDADQRACLEYADAVLIGWPEQDSQEVGDLDPDQLEMVHRHILTMEQRVPEFRKEEREGKIAELCSSLVFITQCVAEVRRVYQPGFALPTYAEIHRVVQEEWNADMERIDPEKADPSAAEIKQEARTEARQEAEEAQREEGE